MSDEQPIVDLFGRQVPVVETNSVRDTWRQTYILTAEHLSQFFTTIRDTPIPPPCGSEQRPHAVHPRAVGWAICANCFVPVRL